MLPMSHAVIPVLPSACVELLGGGGGGGVLSSSYFPGFPLSSWNSGLIHSTSFPSLLYENLNRFHYTLLFVLHKYYQTVSGDQKALTSLLQKDKLYSIIFGDSNVQNIYDKSIAG